MEYHAKVEFSIVIEISCNIVADLYVSDEVMSIFTNAIWFAINETASNSIELLELRFRRFCCHGKLYQQNLNTGTANADGSTDDCS